MPALARLLGGAGRALAVAGGVVREKAFDRPYRAASTLSAELMTWRPWLSSADGAILPTKDFALARAQDLARDNPHARSGIDRRVDLLVGAGLRLVASFDAESLGLDKRKDRDTIRALRRSIEREWRLFANSPGRYADAARQVSLNGRLRQLARTWATNGEVCGVLRWRRTAGGRYRTCFQAIDPTRLCNPNGEPDTVRLRGGIEFDEMGAPVAYHVRNAHVGDAHLGAADEASTWTRVPLETSWGRPVFVHGFEPEREGQSRAMTPFAAIVQDLKMLGQHRDTELANAVANALVVATLETGQDPAVANKLMDVQGTTNAKSRAQHYKENPPTVGGVRAVVLPTGDRLNMNNAPRQTAAFGVFQTAFLRSIAAALGISYEQLSMDWSQTNYSSARAALNEVWRGVKRDFSAFVEQVVMPIYLAFLEEAFDRRYIAAPAGVPGFWDMPEAWAASRWIGSPRGYVDPVKEAQGAALRLDNLTSTLEAECAEQGLDFEDVLDQLQYEQEELKARGLARVSGKVVPAPPDDDEEGDEPEPKRRAAADA